MPSAIPKTSRTKALIIESTAELFNKKGYAGTSLSDLTSATGLTKGSIYGNFDNKEDVALAVFDHNLSVLTAQVDEEVAKATTIQKKLLAYPRTYKKIIRNVLRHGGCPILNTATESDDTNVKLKARATQALSHWEHAIADLITEGIKSGEISKSINTRQLALSIIALIEGGIMMSKLSGDVAGMNLVLATAEFLIRNAEEKSIGR